MDDERKRPAWREPMIWLVVGVPLAAVVAGLWMVVVATRSGGTDGSTDDVRRTGQVQVADLAPDARAAELGLRVVVQVFEGQVRVFPVDGALPRDASLVATFAHPQDAADDITLVLAPDDLGWHVDADVATDHDWLVQLGDSAGTWRVRGRLPRGQQAAHLESSLVAR